MFKAAIITICSLCVFSFVQAQQSFDVHFDFDKHSLTPNARAKLDSFATNHIKDTSQKIYLSGHCDPLGSDQYNDRLSTRRVATVKNYLLRKRIPPSVFVSA